MNATPSDETIRRIMVALDAGGSPALLAAAAALAAALEADLEAVFLEDENLLRSAELPFVREVRLFSSTIEAFDMAGTERELRLLASQLRRALEAEAQQRQVRWDFRVVRGVLEREIESAARRCDLVIVTGTGAGVTGRGLGRWWARAASVRCPGPIMLLPGRAPEMAGPVTAIYDGGRNADRILALAARLARAQDQKLTVLAAGQESEEAARLAETAREWLRARNIAGDVRQVVATRIEPLVELVRAFRGPGKGGTMVLDARAPGMQDADAVGALERLEGAVLLVQQ